ncbi:MAG TPA: hypothetical protein VIW25_15305 [Nitrososphaeraceae archaeon]|jgi:hypothetical protein
MSIDPKMAGNIIQILANMPDFLRKSMLRGKVQEFYSMRNLDKHETISAALKALPSLEGRKLSVLTKTWLEVLSEFEGLKITVILRVYCEELLRNPQILEKLEIELMIDVFSSLPDKRKEKLADCLKEVIFSFPEIDEILKIIPKPALEILNIE